LFVAQTAPIVEHFVYFRSLNFADFEENVSLEVLPRVMLSWVIRQLLHVTGLLIR